METRPNQGSARLGAMTAAYETNVNEPSTEFKGNRWIRVNDVHQHDEETPIPVNRPLRPDRFGHADQSRRRR